MSVKTGFVAGLQGELIAAWRTLQCRGNQLLLVSILTMVLIGAAIAYGTFQFNTMKTLRNGHSTCREMSPHLMLAVMYMGFAFLGISAFTIGSLTELTQRRHDLMRREASNASEWYTSIVRRAYKAALKQTWLFGVIDRRNGATDDRRIGASLKR